MGYAFIILAYDQGFNIVDNTGKQHSDKLHYVPWDFLFDLQPCDQLQTSPSVITDDAPIAQPWTDKDSYILTVRVCSELDRMEFVNNTSKLRMKKPAAAIVQAIRECHCRYGHSP